jgi:6,7-dimethyl-8-ribityllumazine synthase
MGPEVEPKAELRYRPAMPAKRTKKKIHARLALVAAEFNRTLVDGMIASAVDEAKKQGARVALEPVRVPGCYETPLVVSRVIARKEIDAVIVLGYIERGETQHGEVMGHVVHAALVKLAIRHGKPVGIGIIGPGATKEQAEKRKEDYARAAVRAALRARQVG